MTPRIVLALIFIAAIAVAGWQTYRVGKLSEVAGQYEQAVDDMRTAILDQAKRNKQTDALLAKSSREHRAAEIKARGLEDALRNQGDACLDSTFSDDAINRVLEFRTSKD